MDIRGIMIPAIICDLDGCLCDINHRFVHFMNGDMNRFESLIPFDTPNDAVMSVISAMGHSHKIIFITARGSYLRVPTEIWLREFLPSHVKWNLHMRKSAHNDWIVKQAIFNEMIKDHFDVAFVFRLA